MAEIYGKINGKQKRKGEKAIIIAACIIAAIVVALGILGIVIGADSARHREISSAITENSKLKQQIQELNTQIEELNAQVDRLGGELAARPTVAPEETPQPTMTPEPTEQYVSPRGNVQ